MRIIKQIIKSIKDIGLLKTIKIYREYILDYNLFKKQKGNNNDFVFGKNTIYFMDKYFQSGTAKGAYFHQDLLVARRIFENNPNIHIDVGSRIDGFVAHVASFRPIKVIDIRPLSGGGGGVGHNNIQFIQHDFMITKYDMAESCDSLSCLHALEHFGLGRYGDQINFNGHIIGFENLYNLLKSNGKLYFSVPIGLPQRIEFHAHRIFSIKWLLKQFENRYRIDNFSYVDDEGNLHENVTLNERDIDRNYGCLGDGINGCAIFEMTKL